MAITTLFFLNGSYEISDFLQAGEEINIKLYSATTMPTLAQDENAAFWKDTDDSNKLYLVYRRGSGDQIAVELT